MIREKTKKSEWIIDLSGPDGNAFVLMGIAKNIGKQIGMSPDFISEIISEMMSGDYENLLQVFDKHFGEFVILER